MSVQADIGQKIKEAIDNHRGEAAYHSDQADSIEDAWREGDYGWLASARIITQREADIMLGMSPNRRKRTSRNARRHRGVVFTVDLKNKPHVEEVKFTDATGARAVLFRSLSPVVEFAPTESQVKKILSGKGKIHIIEGQITARSRWPNVGKLEHNRSKRTSRRAR